MLLYHSIFSAHTKGLQQLSVLAERNTISEEVEEEPCFARANAKTNNEINVSSVFGIRSLHTVIDYDGLFDVPCDLKLWYVCAISIPPAEVNQMTGTKSGSWPACIHANTKIIKNKVNID